MKTIRTEEATNKINKLMNEVQKTDKPIKIVSRNFNAVLLSNDYWRSIQETINLLSIPEVGRSIVRELNESLANCSTKLNW